MELKNKSNLVLLLPLIGVGAIIYFSNKNNSTISSGGGNTNSGSTPSTSGSSIGSAGFPYETGSPLPVAGVPTSSNTVITSFPATITVNTNLLYVRSAPNTSASLSGSKQLVNGDSFTANGYVIGQMVSGENRWWLSEYGNYVWMGGTAQTPSSALQPQVTTVSSAATQSAQKTTSTSSNSLTTTQNIISSVGSQISNPITTLLNSFFASNPLTLPITGAVTDLPFLLKQNTSVTS